MCIESVELIVAFKLSELSNTKGIPNNSTSSELLAVKDFVFNIVKVELAELSVTSNVTVGVLPVLFVTIIDLIIIVSFVSADNKVVCAVVASAVPLNL